MWVNNGTKRVSTTPYKSCANLVSRIYKQIGGKWWEFEVNPK
jgi:hypothetical protein